MVIQTTSNLRPPRGSDPESAPRAWVPHTRPRIHVWLGAESVSHLRSGTGTQGPPGRSTCRLRQAIETRARGRELAARHSIANKAGCRASGSVGHSCSLRGALSSSTPLVLADSSMVVSKATQGQGVLTGFWSYGRHIHMRVRI